MIDTYRFLMGIVWGSRCAAMVDIGDDVHIVEIVLGAYAGCYVSCSLRWAPLYRMSAET
jgi:hypothetical protein